MAENPNAFDKQSVNSMAPKKPKTPKKPKAPDNPRAPKAVDIFVGSRIRLWRMRREMTQEQLGKALKVAYQQIQKYEKGVNRVAAAWLNDFVNALSVPVSEFFVGVQRRGTQVLRLTKRRIRPPGISDRGSVRKNYRSSRSGDFCSASLRQWHGNSAIPHKGWAVRRSALQGQGAARRLKSLRG